VGDPNLETIEKQLSTRPTIGVPTIVLHGEGDTIHPPEMSKAQEKLFSAHYFAGCWNNMTFAFGLAASNS
jgi:hypothetical protein